MKKFLKRLFGKEEEELEELEELEDCLTSMGIEFPNMEAAEEYFRKTREEKKQKLIALGKEFPEVNFNFKAASLKEVEKLYFDIYVDKRKKC